MVQFSEVWVDKKNAQKQFSSIRKMESFEESKGFTFFGDEKSFFLFPFK